MCGSIRLVSGAEVRVMAEEASRRQFPRGNY
jgi:hypothetical protein